MRIRRRLALLGTFLAATTIGVFAWLITAFVEETAPTEQLERLREIAATTAERFNPGAARPPVIRDAATDVDPFVIVLDRSGDVLYTDAEVAGEPVAVPADLLAGAAEAERDGFVFVAERWGSGTVIAAQSVAGPDRDLVGFRFVMVLAAVLTTIAGGLASWVVSGRALRPLSSLAATADEIARTGDLTRRLAPGRADDEVSRLAAGFNAMMDRLAGSQAELASALDAQRRFVADASHDLRTPITSIRSNARFLADHPAADPADVADALGDIVAESERMSEFVDDLLALARGDAGAVRAPEPVDLGELAAEAARRVGAAASGRALVTGDPVALRRMLDAVVDNAHVHGAGAISIAITGDETATSITVDDHGPGIPPDQLEEIFQRFHRADPNRGGRGHGLGLAIARQIARAHGGEITASNRPDGGARFHIRLPS